MTIEYRRLRAPRNDREVLAVPPLREFENHWYSNGDLLGGHQFALNGEHVANLRQQAQPELLMLAEQYTGQYRDIALGVNRQLPVILAGHQPQLFHPGVWFKNFALSNLSQRIGAVGVNLIVDNDLGTSTRINVPSGSTNAPQVQSIAYDRPGVNLPFEGRRILDSEMWKDFGRRVENAISDFIDEPIIKQLWPDAVNLASLGMGPEYSIAAARHRIEGRLRMATLEVPLSRVCQTFSFARFAAELLFRGQQLIDAHNQILDDYRAVHGIRSVAHPVPSLAQDGEWMEMPFWCWKADNPFRQPLWIRRLPGRVLMTNRRDVELNVSARDLAERIFELNSKGICLRPRALVTTMYSRLVLGQTFLHGIGGAKYDQLTDALIRRFFKCEPPEFLTLTSSNLLPIDLPNVAERDLAEVQTKIRQLKYHAEHLEPCSPNQEREFHVFADQKKDLLVSIPEKGSRKSWHGRMNSINSKLSEMVDCRKQFLLSESEKLREDLGIRRILASREYSFCLFPETIMGTLEHMAAT